MLGICQAPARILLDRTEVRPSGWRLEPMIANLKRAACWINFLRENFPERRVAIASPERYGHYLDRQYNPCTGSSIG